MALVNRSFSVNVTPGMMPPIVHVSEYDVGRAYTVSILDEQGNTFTIPSGTTASIEGTLNGSVGFTQSATISNNQVSFALSQSMTAYSGKAWCKIKLTQNNQPIQTCAFVLAVDRAGVEADTVIDAPSFQEQINEGVAEYFDGDPPFFELPEGGQNGQALVSDGQGGGVWGGKPFQLPPGGEAGQALLSDGSNGAYWGEAQGGGGSGITDEAKTALLNVVAHIGAWSDDQGRSYYDALYAALYPPADLVSISAIFDQGQNIVYNTDSLDSLKQYLTVRGHYSDASIRTITTYTLSGTLTVGTSTIRVSYGGKTTTFNVVVTKYGALPAEYQEVEYITSIGNAYIDTGVLLSGSHSLKTTVRINSATQSNSNFLGVNDYHSGAGKAFGLISFSSAGKIGFFLFGGSAQAIPYDNQFHEYVISASKCSVDGTTYELSGVVDTSFTLTHSLWLFCFRVLNGTDFCNMSMGRTEIDDGSAKKTFVPCYRKADGVIGMFELTSGTFCTNDGTDSFTKGGDVA